MSPGYYMMLVLEDCAISPGVILALRARQVLCMLWSIAAMGVVSSTEMEEMLIEKVGACSSLFGADKLTMGIWACGTIQAQMACTILQSLITRADSLICQFDDAQLGVMTWATAMFEVSLSDQMDQSLHADVISILFP
jgi:hypothetical protein